MVVIKKKRDKEKKVESSEGYNRSWYRFYSMVVKWVVLSVIKVKERLLVNLGIMDNIGV